MARQQNLRRPTDVFALALDAAGALPNEIQILPRGSVKSAKGEFLVDDQAVRELLAHAGSRKTEIVVDYEHQTLKDVEAPAAAWVKRLVDKGEAGIWAEVEWTPRGGEYVKNKEYRYVSPVIGVRQSDGRAVFLHNIGLTNTPAIDGMEPITHKDEGEESMNELLAKLQKLLGLGEDADEAAVLGAIKALKDESEVVAHKDVLTALELPAQATVEQVPAKLTQLKNPAGFVPAADFVALKARMDARDAEDLVQTALKTGKIAPASAGWFREYALKDPTGAKSFLETAPQIVPVGSNLGGGKGPDGAAGVDDVQLAVNKMLGITNEDFKKFGGAGDADK